MDKIIIITMQDRTYHGRDYIITATYVKFRVETQHTVSEDITYIPMHNIMKIVVRRENE